MEMTDSEISLRNKSGSSKHSILRHWRNWKDGTVIETIEPVGNQTEVWWDKTYEPVVLFHHCDSEIVFCDPLSEVLRLKTAGEDGRYTGCRVVALDEFNRLKQHYGGENVHGPGYGITKKVLTLIDLIGSNRDLQEKVWSALSSCVR